jgi:hypothetical protein
MKNLRTFSVSVEIRTGHLSSTSQRRYRVWVRLLGIRGFFIVKYVLDTVVAYYSLIA